MRPRVPRSFVETDAVYHARNIGAELHPNVAAVLLIHAVPGAAVASHIDTPVGGGGVADIITLAVPVWPPRKPVTANGPPVALPAVNSPDEEIVPPLFTAHVNVAEAIKLPELVRRRSRGIAASRS